MATKQPAKEQEAPPVNTVPGKQHHITENSSHNHRCFFCVELSKILFKKDASGKSQLSRDAKYACTLLAIDPQDLLPR